MEELQRKDIKQDRNNIASKFLSKVIENEVRQNLFCSLQNNDSKCSISEKKAIHMMNDRLIVPIEVNLDDSHILCCLKNFEEQGIMYVMYEDAVKESEKTVLINELDYEKALQVIRKHTENQAISKTYMVYEKEAENVLAKYYQDKYDSINTKDNNIEDVIEYVRDREGIDGHICYMLNRTNPENVAEIITIKKYKENGAYILISEINIYKEDKRVKAYSEVEREYGHLWQQIKEHIIEYMDAESGVVVFNTLQEVLKYKEIFYEQLSIRDDVDYDIFESNMAKMGNSEYYDEIIDELDNELKENICLFVEEKENIRDQIDNYKYIQVLMKEYESNVIEYMTRGNTNLDDEFKEWEQDLKIELDEKEEELSLYIQKSKVLQVARFCIIRNCIGKSTAELIRDFIDRNIDVKANVIESKPYMVNENTGSVVFGGLDSKLNQIRNKIMMDIKGEGVS